jgi:hypothetical protein
VSLAADGASSLADGAASLAADGAVSLAADGASSLAADGATRRSEKSVLDGGPWPAAVACAGGEAGSMAIGEEKREVGSGWRWALLVGLRISK